MESPPFPVPAPGWRIDQSGITHPRGRIPWSEVAEVTHVQAVLRTTTTDRVVSGVVAVALLGLAVLEVIIGLTSGLDEAPLVALSLVVAGGLMAWAALLLVHQGWRSATITVNDVVVRSPFMRRRVPLAKVFAFQHYSSSLGRRTCGVLCWLDEPGRRSARLALPGSDPDYRLPALDAYVKGLRPQAPR